MTLFVCPNAADSERMEKSKNCINTLAKNNRVAMSKADNDVLFPGEDFATFTPSEADVIVSIGGDGAVLRASKIALEAGKPLLGINGGRLGYLCAVDINNADKVDDKLIEKLNLTKRSVLQFECKGKKYNALNDVVVSKRNFGETVDLEVVLNGEMLAEVRCDGIIVATPTGSTSYSLSAGAPIMQSDVEAIVITPICPHSVDARPIVTSDKTEIEIRLSETSHNGAELYCDGALVEGESTTITIRKSDKTLSLYTSDKLTRFPV